MQRNVGYNGLEKVYRSTPPYDGPEFALVHKWIRRLIALAVSRVQYHQVVWNDCLTNPPLTGDALVDANLRNFRDYFKNQWLTNLEKTVLSFSVLWNHYDRAALIMQKLTMVDCARPSTPE